MSNLPQVGAIVNVKTDHGPVHVGSILTIGIEDHEVKIEITESVNELISGVITSVQPTPPPPESDDQIIWRIVQAVADPKNHRVSVEWQPFFCAFCGAEELDGHMQHEPDCVVPEAQRLTDS